MQFWFLFKKKGHFVENHRNISVIFYEFLFLSVPWWRGLNCYLFCLIFSPLFVKHKEPASLTAPGEEIPPVARHIPRLSCGYCCCEWPPSNAKPPPHGVSLIPLFCLGPFILVFLTWLLTLCHLRVSSSVAKCFYRKHRNLRHLLTDCHRPIASLARDHTEIAIIRVSFSWNYCLLFISNISE